MLDRLLQFALFVGCHFGFVVSASAHTTTLAITGKDVPGVPSATWRQLGDVQLNNAGAVAFNGKLEHSLAIDSSNDVGLWLFDDVGQHLLARTGVGGVPGVEGADFADLDTPQLGETNSVFASAHLLVGSQGVTTGNDEGVWKFTNASGDLVMRSGSGLVPGVDNASFDRAPDPLGSTDISLATNGDFAFAGVMRPGVGGVLSTNDRGIWKFEGEDAQLVAREDFQGVPDIPNVSFSSFGTPRINAAEQLAFLGGLKVDGGVSSSNDTGVWRYTTSSGELLAQEGSGNVPGFPAHSFHALSQVRMNGHGHVAFDASLDSQSGTRGIWLYSETTSEVVAAEGSIVPDVAGASFESVLLSNLNDAGHVLASAELEVGVGSVTSADREGLWLLNENASLVARSGSGGVPGVPGADFSTFSSAALNQNGSVAFVANLEVAGDVDASSNQGIWIVGTQGESWLVARTGDHLAGRTIAALGFLGDTETARGTGFNDLGEVAYRAEFTNGDSGVFLFRPYASDFNRDGVVDDGDLTVWGESYGSSTLADADEDNDSDGADFLVWQREFGSGGALQPISSEVPEPNSYLLLMFTALCHISVSRQ